MCVRGYRGAVELSLFLNEMVVGSIRTSYWIIIIILFKKLSAVSSHIIQHKKYLTAERGEWSFLTPGYLCLRT